MTPLSFLNSEKHKKCNSIINQLLFTNEEITKKTIIIIAYCQIGILHVPDGTALNHIRTEPGGFNYLYHKWGMVDFPLCE